MCFSSRLTFSGVKQWYRFQCYALRDTFRTHRSSSSNCKTLEKLWASPFLWMSFIPCYWGSIPQGLWFLQKLVWEGLTESSLHSSVITSSTAGPGCWSLSVSSSPTKRSSYFDAEMLDHPHVPSGRCSASAEGQKRIPGPLQPCSNAHAKVYVQPGSPADPLLRCHLIHISAEALHKGKLPL